MKIRVGIVGYGNLGRGAAQAVMAREDMELAAIFSRRRLSAGDVPLYSTEQILSFQGKIDVLLLCGGSAKDLPVQSPYYGRYFAIADTYDDHENAAVHLAACHNSHHAAILCAGWDPGLFSIQRVLCKSIFPQLQPQTFWGPGVSQGHSDAIRTIAGVADARQYTVPSEEALQRARMGEQVPKEKAHRRVCFVVTEPGADREKIQRQIQKMPHYFAPYETEVNFCCREELESTLPHGGRVIGGNGQMELALSMPSNPHFTGAVLAAYGAAAYRLEKAGIFGAKTPLDVPVSFLLPEDSSKYI